MEEQFKRETEALKRSWMRWSSEMLRDYLVQDVQDPRINTQSILTRHFLIERLFGERFSEVMEQELRFALVVNWLLELLKKPLRAWQLHAVPDALLQGHKSANGLKIPRFVSETFACLAKPNYICDLFTWAPVETTDVPIPDYLMNTFQAIWQELLQDEHPRPISVLEPACGSANDYRFIDTFGIGRLLDYKGLDLCEKNIRNAKQMFPDVHFEVGNVLEIDDPDSVFDYCFVHDLFEHLSLEAMQAAISEVCRVTRCGICVGFFNMHNQEQDVVTAVGNYHWNGLSMPRTRAIFEKCGCTVYVVNIDTFLKQRFGYADTHNKGAYTFIVMI
jgi:ubiquinone/menaquinone biosynthesis C-methylase UbiE